MTPLISVVTGTYNRINSFREMLDSIANTVSDDVGLEYILADNGSTDGTAEWLADEMQARPNVTVIQFGEPVGAVKAFTEAAYQATGQYVLLATDDILFPPTSILKALQHLETHPTCGAVTFMHNKGHDYAPDVAPFRSPDGTVAAKPYPQIALVRRWLGDRVGWWGGRHEVMKDAFTYAGDNFLGAGIWGLGYSVDTVQGAVNIERVYEDAPRQMNRDHHRKDADLYYSLYPDGAPYHNTPQVTNSDSERLRILYAVHYDTRYRDHRENKRGMKDALKRYGVLVEYDYARQAEHGVDTTREFSELAQAWQPHIVFTQVHGAGRGITVEALQRARTYSPHSVFINWMGDYWPRLYIEPQNVRLLRQYDLTIASNAWGIQQLCKQGVCAAHMPHSFEPVVIDTTQPAYDVVYSGHGYTDFVKALAAFIKALPCSTGLYGKFGDIPADGYTHYNHAAQQGIYHNAKMAISPMQFQDGTAYGYVSNRFWEILGSGGALCLQQASPGLDATTGIKAGVHYVEWHTLDELRGLIDYYLTHEDERRGIVEAAYTLVREQHRFDDRIKHLLMEDLSTLYATSNRHVQHAPAG